ncbi:MAG: rRNA maturation RNase YbeY [Brevefilum sp.]
MAIEIIIESTAVNPPDQQMLVKAIQTTLDFEGMPNSDLTLKFTGDIEMRQLNQTYRQIDQTTDVLSFSQDYIDPETGRLYLGDIIISLEQAQKQAQENHRALHEECARLVIHGTLHLIGYDHAEPDEEAYMWELQERLLVSILSPDREGNE